MTKTKIIQLNNILNDKISGSSELVKLLNIYLFSIRNNHSQINSTIKQARKKIGHFETVNRYLNKVESHLHRNNNSEFINFLKDFYDNEKTKMEVMFKNIYPTLKRLQNMITLSRSGTVIDILKLWHNENKKLNVVVCESRPRFEGRLIAENLARNGIKVNLITDAMMGLYVEKVDAAIIGADIVLKNGNVVNKVGSKALALLCKEYKKPFYVLTTKSKFSRKLRFAHINENPKEIINNKIKNLSASNYYFEEIEKKFITKIFAE